MLTDQNKDSKRSASYLNKKANQPKTKNASKTVEQDSVKAKDITKHLSQEYKLDDIVEANWMNMGCWFKGKICSVRPF